MLWQDICVLNCAFTLLPNFLWPLTVNFSPRKNRNHNPVVCGVLSLRGISLSNV